MLLPKLCQIINHLEMMAPQKKWINIPLYNSIMKSYRNWELSISPKQAVKNSYRKKDKNKKLIKDWRPISLLNVDIRLISKVVAERIIKLLPSLISKNQTVYVKGKFISKGDRLISDILEIFDNLKIKNF